MEKLTKYPGLRSVAEIQHSLNPRSSGANGRANAAGLATQPYHLFAFVLPVSIVLSLLVYSGLNHLFPLEHPYMTVRLDEKSVLEKGSSIVLVSKKSLPVAAKTEPLNVLPVRESEEDAADRSPSYYLVTVEPGDTLSSIARRIYGRSSQYDELYEINQDMLENPHALRLGQQIRVPR